MLMATLLKIDESPTSFTVVMIGTDSIARACLREPNPELRLLICTVIGRVAS
jgi:hypothetical protein